MAAKKASKKGGSRKGGGGKKRDEGRPLSLNDVDDLAALIAAAAPAIAAELQRCSRTYSCRKNPITGRCELYDSTADGGKGKFIGVACGPCAKGHPDKECGGPETALVCRFRHATQRYELYDSANETWHGPCLHPDDPRPRPGRKKKTRSVKARARR